MVSEMNKSQRLAINQRRFAGPRLVLFASFMICVVVGIFFMVGNLLTRQSSATVMGDMEGSFSQITSVDTHTCALTTEGKAYCWGVNQHGQLGNNSTASSLTPLAVSSAGVNVPVEQSASRLYKWNNAVQPGTPLAATNAVATLPEVGSSFRIRVGLTAAGNKTLQSITADYFHTCALTTTGQAYCWGWNQYGQLGNNSTTDSRIPVAIQMPAGVTRFQSIAAGYYHTCALTNEGKAYCWGQGDVGQLGNNSTTSSPIPVAASVKTMNNTTVPPGNMKLRAQYAKKTAASCSAVPSGDWQNITTNSSLRYAATGPAHQTAISAISDNPALPTNSHNYAHQSIVRPTTDSSLTFTNDQGIESGQTGLWDLVLADNGLEQNTSYCVRVVTDTAAAPGTSVDTYTAYPEFKTPTGSLDIRFVNNTTNATIANPTIDFTPTVTQSSVARTTANLTEAATGTRHLEIKNTLPTGWSVTLSATAGSNARWSSGTDDYAFNGTEANGRLSVLFNNTVITRISGSTACASATKGQNGVFTATNTVKIASAGGGAAGCTYRIADIGLQQTIPVYQKPGSYTLPMTLTAVVE